jgi:hypothetical protein
VRYTREKKKGEHHPKLVAGFSRRRPKFDPGSGHMGFVVDKVEWG